MTYFFVCKVQFSTIQCMDIVLAHIHLENRSCLKVMRILATVLFGGGYSLSFEYSVNKKYTFNKHWL